ncbi:MAG: GNAT family N-acetyltransferase [Streptosporangiaceae bacterium]
MDSDTVVGEPLATRLTVVRANRVPWADLQAILGTGEARHCYCQHFQTRDCQWKSLADQDRQDRLRAQTQCGNPHAETTTGLVAYLGHELAGGEPAEREPTGGGPAGQEPVGWVAVGPRTSYPRLLRTRTVWSGRQEDKTDDNVWSVTCFVTRKGYRKRGITYALAAATIGFAREEGARVLEAYPMITEPGKEIIWGEMYVGSRQVFADAGFAEVSRPSPRRVVMRIDLTG